ncbi:hypothetical protein C9J85_12075 [Haloferax sp. wsp5]|nr:hypothetical protein C9J85_12075 [Haloferax sp. wsp5]
MTLLVGHSCWACYLPACRHPQRCFRHPGQAIGSGFGLVPFLGQVFFFFLIVGPVEETVKLLAVRLYAYSHDSFNAVIDGAVYGAMAGLGFATIENALYITRNARVGFRRRRIIAAGGTITAVRALAGPGHVIYSAIAGYYLGLAKFNKENAGPIVIKGLILAALVHATYNSTVGLGYGHRGDRNNATPRRVLRRRHRARLVFGLLLLIGSRLSAGVHSCSEDPARPSSARNRPSSTLRQAVRRTVRPRRPPSPDRRPTSPTASSRRTSSG